MIFLIHHLYSNLPCLLMTSLFFSYKSEQNLQETLNLELSKVSNWLSANKLSINVDKSKLLIFSQRNSITKAELSINNEKLHEVNHAKYLGVLIDNKLKWDYHINSISLKLSKGIGLCQNQTLCP